MDTQAASTAPNTGTRRLPSRLPRLAVNVDATGQSRRRAPAGVWENKCRASSYLTWNPLPKFQKWFSKKFYLFDLGTTVPSYHPRADPRPPPETRFLHVLSGYPWTRFGSALRIFFTATSASRCGRGSRSGARISSLGLRIRSATSASRSSCSDPQRHIRRLDRVARIRSATSAARSRLPQTQAHGACQAGFRG